MIIAASKLFCMFVGLRMYTRLFLTKSTAWDDWTIALASVLSSLLGSLVRESGKVDEA